MGKINFGEGEVLELCKTLDNHYIIVLSVDKILKFYDFERKEYHHEQVTELPHLLGLVDIPELNIYLTLKSRPRTITIYDKNEMK